MVRMLTRTTGGLTCPIVSTVRLREIALDLHRNRAYGSFDTGKHDTCSSIKVWTFTPGVMTVLKCRRLCEAHLRQSVETHEKNRDNLTEPSLRKYRVICL